MSARVSAPDGASRTLQFAGAAGRGEQRRLFWCLAIALMLHQPLMASSLFSWMRVLFREQPEDIEPPPDQEALLSVELDDGLFGDEPEPAGGKPAAGAAGSDDEGDGILLVDGGVSDPDDEDDEDDEDDDDEDVSFDDDDDDDEPADAGAPEPDAGALVADGGVPLPDAGAPEPDAGPLDEPDAGAGGAGAGTDEPDAGIALGDPPDAGALPVASSSAAPASADAGVSPDAGADIYDMEPLDAGPPPDAGPRVGPPVKDPNALAGGAQAIRSRHPNVRIYIAADVLRRHQLASTFGNLLNAVPEWNELLGGTGIDPIRDFDHLLITGPQMRNPRWIIATMDYNVSNEKMRAAVDKVVKRSAPDGKWLPEDAHPVPVAVIGKKGYRRVALVEKHKLLVVVPKRAEKQLSKLAKAKPFRKSRSSGIVLYVRYPAKAVRGFALPKSLKWMRLRLGFQGKDGFRVHIDAQDKSAEEAIKSARKVERELEALRPVPLSGFITSKKYFFGKPTFKVEGRMIRVSAELTQDQVDRIMGLIDVWLGERAEKK